MNDTIQMVIIAGNNALDRINRDGEMEFMFSVKYKNKDEYEFDNHTVKTEEELKDIIDYTEMLRIYREQNNLDEKEAGYKLVQHIDFFKNYLTEKYPRVAQSLHLERFNSHNEQLLFALFAERENVIIANSLYATVIYLPKRPSQKIKQALLDLTSLFAEDKITEAKVVTSAKDIDKSEILIGSYQDIISQYLGIDFSQIENTASK